MSLIACLLPTILRAQCSLLGLPSLMSNDVLLKDAYSPQFLTVRDTAYQSLGNDEFGPEEEDDDEEEPIPHLHEGWFINQYFIYTLRAL